MIVFVVNKLKDYIESSSLKDLDYKNAVGCYEAATFVKNLKSLDIDMLLIDATAIKDANKVEAWESFKELVPAENIFVLQESNSSNYELLSILVKSGLYNFGKSTNEILNCMERPNTLADVQKYVSKSSPVTTSSSKVVKEVAGYSEKNQQQQDAMKDYLKRYNDGEIDETQNNSVLGMQLLTGLVHLPLLTLLSTGLFYFLSRIIYSKVSYDTYLGKAMYDSHINTEFNLVVLIGLFVSFIIFIFYYSVLDPKIKRKQYTRGKFMILPMGLYIIVFFGDYYLFGLFEMLFSNIPNITTAEYLFENLLVFNHLVVILAVITYYFKLAVSRSKMLIFEKDLSQRFNIAEKLYVVVLGISILVPVLYFLFNAIMPTSSLFNLFKELYVDGIFMTIITVINIVLIVWIFINKILYPVQEVEYKEMEI